jgi:hypothetical protein
LVPNKLPQQLTHSSSTPTSSRSSPAYSYQSFKATASPVRSPWKKACRSFWLEF